MSIKEKLIRIVKHYVVLKKEDDSEFRRVYLRISPALMVKVGKQRKKRSRYLRTCITVSMKMVFHFRYKRLPIQNNKIVFDNYMGKGYGCNSKYVAEEIRKKYPGRFDLVWIVSENDLKRCDFPEGIRPVVYESRDALKEYATAKIWVSNYHKISFIKRGLQKKPGQIFIQMWHGSLGIKKIEADVKLLTDNSAWQNYAIQSSDMVDYWISNSAFETEIYKKAFWNAEEKIYEYGHPRNDILFGDNATLRAKVKDFFGISEDKHILLYVPTFREDYRLDCYQLDYDGLQEALSERFGGEWVFLVRLHPRVKKHSKEVIASDNENIYNATFYVDIQELLAAADCMISDYSSCMFDYVLTERPVFVYATDIEEYNTERGFYYPLSETPFPVAENNTQLQENIKSFDDEKYKKDAKRFIKEKGCIDDGNASKRVAEMIGKYLA